MDKKKQKKTAILHVRLLPDIANRIDSYCRKAGITKTAWVEFMAKRCMKQIK